MKKNRLLALLLMLAMLIGMACTAAVAEDAVPGDVQDEGASWEGTENDVLFLQYLEKKATEPKTGGRRLLKAGPSTLGSKLEEPARTIYNSLKAHIEAVAAGDEDYTVFTLTTEEVGLQAQFTCADLGLPGDASFEDGYAIISTKIQKAFADTHAALDALIWDMPYDLFWFDKTQSFGASGGVSTGGTIDTDTGEIIWTLGYEFSPVAMPVAQAYAADDSYHTKADQIASALPAMQRALTIVSTHAGEDDYTKLVSYKDEICDLVDYNYAVLDNPPPYGDPWQMIFVFDGDASTKVVCEGYSKAFKFLCDRSAFESDAVTCYLVTGKMDGGAHMWNIVTLDNGQNYMADVTNSDPDPNEDGSVSVGYDGSLFLAIPISVSGNTLTFRNAFDTTEYVYDAGTLGSYDSTVLTVAGAAYQTHTQAAGADHTLEKVEGREATCTEAGTAAYYRCVSCGKAFSGRTGVQEIDLTALTVPALGHNFTGGNGACVRCGQNCQHAYTETGRTLADTVYTQADAQVHQVKEIYDVVKTCGICGTVSTTQEEVSKGTAAHVFGDDSICTQCGFGCEHTFDENGVCTKCGYVCDHGEVNTVKTGVGNPTYVSTGADGHDVYQQERTVITCKTCGKVLSDTQANVKTGTESHAFQENGVCAKCEYVCQHPSYSDGACTVCGVVCTHTHTATQTTVTGSGYIAVGESGHTLEESLEVITQCSDCGAIISTDHQTRRGDTVTHTFNAEGQCTVCAYQCPHDAYENGVCTVCGYACPHDFADNDGVCALCGYECQHDGEAVIAAVERDDTTEECLPLDGENHKIILHHVDLHYNCPICGKEYRIEEDAEAFHRGDGEHSFDENGECQQCGLLLPAAPTVKVTTAGTKATVTWNQVAGADKYIVYGGEKGSISKLGETDQLTFAHTVTGGKTYQYYVAAANDYCQSEMSGTVTVTALAKPAGVKAKMTKRQTTVTWSKVTGATSYKVYGGVKGSLKLLKSGITGTSYTSANQTYGKTYQYYVVAVNANGKSANSASVTTLALNKPTSLTLTPTTYGAKLTWTKVTGATGYQVLRDGKVIATIKKATTLTYTDKTFKTAGKKCKYAVRAIASGTYTKVTLTKAYIHLAAVTGVTLKNTTAKKLVITWKAAKGAGSYEVYYTTSTKKPTAATKATKTVTKTALTVTVTKGKTYYVYVRPVGLNGTTKTVGIWTAVKKLTITR